jgi:hypothetical protein
LWHLPRHYHQDDASHNADQQDTAQQQHVQPFRALIPCLLGLRPSSSTFARPSQAPAGSGILGIDLEDAVQVADALLGVIGEGCQPQQGFYVIGLSIQNQGEALLRMPSPALPG